MSEKDFFKNIDKGHLGDFVDNLSPLTEANRESLLLQLLTCYGSCLGRSARFMAGEDKHFTNLFVVIVGRSAKGRKGQSLNLIKSLFYDLDREWCENRVKKGLSSGEGLIDHVRDSDSDSLGTGREDKRLLITESEFSSVLKMTQREGNVLSQVLRDAWDGVRLETLTKHNPIRSSEPMVSIIGHITIAELHRFLNSTEIANGLGNRFIYIKAHTDKLLPDPKPIEENLRSTLQDYLKESLVEAREVQMMNFDEDASEYWHDLYHRIAADEYGIVGSLTARQEAQIRRLAMIIALFNKKKYIDLSSLMFAEKIFDYSIETLREIYGKSSGDRMTDKVLDLLSCSESGLSRTELHGFLGKNYRKETLDFSLRSLKSQNLIDCKRLANHQGRPTELWFVK